SFLFPASPPTRDLHSFPTRRSSDLWRESWDYVIPFLAFEPDVRRVIYTTNAIEALNRQLRKAVKTKGHFPTEDAARKLLYLAIQDRKSTRLNSSHSQISYAVFCLKK